MNEENILQIQEICDHYILQSKGNWDSKYNHGIYHIQAAGVNPNTQV